MKLINVIAVLGVVAAATAHPGQIQTLLDALHGSARIISGEPADLGQFPWQAAVNFNTPSGTFFCGGALIHPQWILTAAHCADGASDFVIQLGATKLDGSESGSIMVPTKVAFVHSNYNPWTLANDIALVKLPSAVELTDNIKTIALPKRDQYTGADEQLTVSGWGKTSDGPTGISSILNHVTLRSITNKECADVYGSVVIGESTICCKGNPEHSTCNGDSGGPLITHDESGNAVHVGVVSFVSSAGCASGHPSGYVRTESFLDWISGHTGIEV